MAYDYDLFVIGAGSGGVRAARLAAMTGKKVAVAEEYRAGGTCVIRGCVPKKYMVYASEFGRSLHHMKGYGWTVENASYDHNLFMDKMHREVDRLSGIYARNLRNAGVEIIEERAEFADAHTLKLLKSGRTVTAAKILIAVGGAPIMPQDVEGIDLAISSNEMFHLDALPEHIVIVGGGYIAVEFAGIMNGLGARVCLVYRGETVLRGFDDDVRTHVHDELKRKGVKVVTNAAPEGAQERQRQDHHDAVEQRDSDGRQDPVRRGPRAAHEGARPRQGRREAQRQGRGDRRRLFAHQCPAHLGRGRCDRPGEPDPRGHPGRAGLRPDRIHGQADRFRPRRHPPRRLHPAPGRASSA